MVLLIVKTSGKGNAYLVRDGEDGGMREGRSYHLLNDFIGLLVH